MDAKLPEDKPDFGDMFAMMEKLASDERYFGDSFSPVRTTLIELTKAYGMCVNDVASAGASLMMHKPDPAVASDSYGQVAYAILIALSAECSNRTEAAIQEIMWKAGHVLILEDAGDHIGAAKQFLAATKAAEDARAQTFVDLLSIAIIMRGISTMYADTTDVREAFFVKATHIINTATALFPKEAMAASDASRKLGVTVNGEKT